MGTWEVTRAFGEKLEMHKIELNHNVLGCQECSVCQGHSHPKLPVSPSCTQQLLSTKDGCTPVGCP